MASRLLGPALGLETELIMRSQPIAIMWLLAGSLVVGEWSPTGTVCGSGREPLGAAEPVPASTASPSTVTFSRDLAPVLFAKCANCHHAGSIGPFPLLSYTDARDRGRQLAAVVHDRVMPPWMPAAGWGEFAADRSLSAAERQLFADWVAGGMIEGDPADLPPLPTFREGWQLGTPDLILTMREPFSVPAEGRDVYHHFVFPLDLKRETYLRGIEVIPGNRRVAHHAVGILDTTGKARKRAKRHGGESYPGNDAGFVPSGFTPGYAPGAEPRFFADGEAITLKPGTDLVLQMHYSPSGKPETDLTQIGLYFSETPPKRNVGILLLGSVEIDIPPGDDQYRRRDSYRVPCDYEVGSIWAHMHLIGREVKVWAELPDRTRKNLLWIPRWDFNWQDTYPYAERFVLPKDTVIHAEFWWDNSADNPRNPHDPPERVLNGEQSSNEMGGVIIGGRPVRASDEFWTWMTVLGHYLEVESRKPAAAKK